MRSRSAASSKCSVVEASRDESRVVGRRVSLRRDRASVLARLIAVERVPSSEWVLVLEDAIDLVKYAANKGKNGEILIKKAPSAKIIDVAKELFKIYNKGFEMACQPLLFDGLFLILSSAN